MPTEMSSHSGGCKQLILACNLPILVPVVAPFAELRLSAKSVAYIDSQAEIAVVDSCAVGAIVEI